MSSYTASKYQSVSIFSPDGTVNALNNIKQATMLGSTAVMGVGRHCGMIISWRSTTSSTPGPITPSDDLALPSRKIFVSQNDLSSFLFTFSGITNDGHLLHRQVQQHKLMENIWKNRRTGLRLNEWREQCGWRCILNGDRAWGVVGLYVGWTAGPETEKVTREWLINQSSKDSTGSIDSPNTTTGEKVFYSHKYDQKTVSPPYLAGYELCPTGTIRHVRFTAIGTRAQSCKTILELNETEIQSPEQMKDLLVRALRNAHGEGITEEQFKQCLEGWCIDKSGVWQLLEF